MYHYDISDSVRLELTSRRAQLIEQYWSLQSVAAADLGVRLVSLARSGTFPMASRAVYLSHRLAETSHEPPGSPMHPRVSARYLAEMAYAQQEWRELQSIGRFKRN